MGTQKVKWVNYAERQEVVTTNGHELTRIQGRTVTNSRFEISDFISVKRDGWLTLVDWTRRLTHLNFTNTAALAAEALGRNVPCSRLASRSETVETVEHAFAPFPTALKPGVNRENLNFRSVCSESIH
jgi:hypothetical protein